MQPETTGHKIRSIGSYTGFVSLIAAVTALLTQINDCRNTTLQFRELKASVAQADAKAAKVSRAQQALANDSVPLVP
jgi:hypothetical protein